MRFFLRLSCCSPVNSRDCFDLLPTVSGIHLPSMSIIPVAHQESPLVCMHSQARGCRRMEDLIPMLQTASEHCQSSSMYRDDIDSIASDRKLVFTCAIFLHNGGCLEPCIAHSKSVENFGSIND